MNYLQFYYNTTFKYEYINKFISYNTRNIPIVKKIVLNFGCKSANIKELASSLLALELITGQEGELNRTKYSNILLKIRKGNPTGCKVTLAKVKSFIFLQKIVTEIIPNIKNFNGFLNKNKTNSFSFNLLDIFNFSDLEQRYYLFNILHKLNITIITNSNSNLELMFLLNSLKILVLNKRK